MKLHASETVDIGYVISGSVTLVLPDGNETTLAANDSFVLRGGEHAWRNDADGALCHGGCTTQAVAVVGGSVVSQDLFEIAGAYSTSFGTHAETQPLVTRPRSRGGSPNRRSVPRE